MENNNKVTVESVLFSLGRYLRNCEPDELIYFETEFNQILVNLEKDSQTKISDGPNKKVKLV
ncbi:MAG: hypothetical protein HQM14_18205 [SAR324 cluster bacterium]|nr:hypothetical protein [SAR324 cluster bacterium]